MWMSWIRTAMEQNLPWHHREVRLKLLSTKQTMSSFFLFLNISVCVDQACPSLNKTAAWICLNQQLSDVINAIFLEKEKRSGNVLELQRRRDVNKLSGNCSRNYKFLQDTFKWGLWQLGTQTGWLMGLLTCRKVALRKPLWHMSSEWSEQLELSTFQWLVIHVHCFDRHYPPP